MNPLVTVLLPTYNSGKYLKESVKSILYQTYTNFELIIINDGSTDDTQDILGRFKDKRIRVVNNNQNNGLISALNKGMDLARGKYISRMDADDISTKDRIETQVLFMESNPQINILGSWIQVFEDKSYIWKTPSNPKEIKARMLFESVIAHPSVMIRKKFLTENDLFYRKEYKYAEDYDLWVRAAKITPITNIQKVLLKYRTHDDQVGRLQKKKQNISAAKIRVRQLEELEIKPTEKQIIIHLNIGEWRGVKNKDMLISVKKWVHTIIKANTKSKIYDRTYLNYILMERWLGVVYSSRKLGFIRWVWLFDIPLRYAPYLLVAIFSSQKRRLFK